MQARVVSRSLPQAPMASNPALPGGSYKTSPAANGYQSMHIAQPASLPANLPDDHYKSLHRPAGQTVQQNLTASGSSSSSASKESKAGYPYRWATCPQCDEPTKHVRERSECMSYLTCSAMRGLACESCEQELSPGEPHWFCRACRTCVCDECGPKVIISEKYDYVDCASGEHEQIDITDDGDAPIMHRRRTRSTKPTGEDVAAAIVKQASRLVAKVHNEDADCFDRDWADKDLLLLLLGASDASEAAENLQLLVASARGVLADQPTLVEVEAPCKVFGDVHGQLRDMLTLFGTFGMPGKRGAPNFVFNGDFVDRGTHQVEVISVMFALKVCFPDQVYLVRGNHEDAVMNEMYGFTEACVRQFGEPVGKPVFAAFTDAFNYLPMAALIDSKILCVHGGLGKGKWNLDELRNVRRPLTHQDLEAAGNEWLWNILWSDPVEEDAIEASMIFGVHSSPRGGSSVQFGVDVTLDFCQRNEVELVVRSHQAKQCGVGFEIMHDMRLARVFSARDYEGHGNDAACLHVSPFEKGQNEGLLIVRAQVIRSLTKKGEIEGEGNTPNRK